MGWGGGGAGGGEADKEHALCGTKSTLLTLHTIPLGAGRRALHTLYTQSLRGARRRELFSTHSTRNPFGVPDEEHSSLHTLHAIPSGCRTKSTLLYTLYTQSLRGAGRRALFSTHSTRNPFGVPDEEHSPHSTRNPFGVPDRHHAPLEAHDPNR